MVETHDCMGNGAGTGEEVEDKSTELIGNNEFKAVLYSIWEFRIIKSLAN